MDQYEIETPHGPARVELRQAEDPRAALVLGHGAGGGIKAPDLQIAADVALAESVSVALVEQPYRVAGRRSPAPAPQLDAAWLAVIRYLINDLADRGGGGGRAGGAGTLAGLVLIAGGRSAGARVACRTAEAAGAIAVLCLAFPLHAPGRAAAAAAKTRLPELDQVTVPTLVVQGDRDPFGIPPEGPNRSVVLVQGDHSLRKDRAAIADAISGWLAAVLPRR